MTRNHAQEPVSHGDERVSIDELTRVIEGRRSVRVYQPHAVTREQIIKLLEAARWAPSPHGRQPWRFAVITQPTTRKRLAHAMGENWRHQLEQDEHEAHNIHLRLEKSYQRIRSAPAIIIPCLYLRDMDHYPDDERQTAEHTMAVQSLGCAVQNMLLMAYGLGLDCGWMCAPLFCSDAVRDALELDSWMIPHALITVGYAAEDPPRRPHVPVEDLLILYE
jgi:F420 biosynthesis protein FbiB-like protein